MQKVIENLGLDKTSMVTLYGPNIQVIDNKQCKSNEKLVDEDHIEYKSDSFNAKKASHLHSAKSVSKFKNDSAAIKRKRNEFEEDNLDGSDQEANNNTTGYAKNKHCEYEEDDDVYEQLNEEEEVDDEYEVLEYNEYDETNGQAQAHYYNEDENVDMDDEYNNEQNEYAEQDDEQLNNYDNQEINSQFTDEENNNEMNNQNINYENDLNEIDNEEEELDYLVD